eukprot:6209763-Pleurochrysis_carterae.AAC.2
MGKSARLLVKDVQRPHTCLTARSRAYARAHASVCIRDALHTKTHVSWHGLPVASAHVPTGLKYSLYMWRETTTHHLIPLFFIARATSSSRTERTTLARCAPLTINMTSNPIERPPSTLKISFEWRRLCTSGSVRFRDCPGPMSTTCHVPSSAIAATHARQRDLQVPGGNNH